MSILSSIGSYLSNAAHSVYNTVSNVFSGTSGSSQSANALDFNNPVNNALQASGAPQKTLAAAVASPVKTGVDSGGTSYYNNSVPAKAASIGYTPVSSYSGLSGSIPTGVSFGTNPAVNINAATKSGGITSSGSVGGSSLGGVGYQPSTLSTKTASNSTNFSTGLASPSFSSPSNVSISAGTLGSGTSSVLAPSAPSGTNYYGNVIAGNTAVGGDSKTGQLPITATTGTTVTNGANSTNGSTNTNGTNPDGTPVKSVSDRINELLGLYKNPASETDAYSRAVQQTGLLQAQQKRLNTQNEINGVTAQMNSDLQNLRGTAQKEGVTEAVYGGQQAEVTREATVRLLPLQAQLAADQGNLELAQQNTNQLFKIYSDDAQKSVDFYNQNVKAAYDLFTADEKKQADQLLWQKNYNKDVVQADAKNQADIANELLKSGNISGYKALTAIQPPINMQSPTFAQDYAKYKQQLNQATAQFGAGIGGVDRQLKQQELTNAQLQGKKLANEVAAGSPATGEYASVIDGAASLVSAAQKQGTKTTIANALAQGDFNTAYATVANSVSNTLTGSSKTKFEDTVTDVGVMSGLKNAIQQYANAGGNMGLLKGKADDIAKNFGQLETDPKFASLAVELQREFQSYRLGMTGAAFSPAESREYAKVNPRADASLDLNLATIDGALAQLTNRVTSTVNARIPGAQKIYDLANPKQGKTGGTLVTAPDGTQVIITD